MDGESMDYFKLLFILKLVKKLLQNNITRNINKHKGTN